MPIFEFRCLSCKEEFEDLVSGNEKVVCPACGGRRAEKKFSIFSSGGGGGGGGGSCSSCAGSSCSGCSSAH